MNRSRALAQISSCLKGRAPHNAEWTEILTVANQHWITAELCVALENDDNVPDDVRGFLEEVFKRNVERNSDLFATLKDALSALNASGIEPVLVKGCATWAVADKVSEAPRTGRTLSDLDLVAPADAFEASVTALQAAGFQLIEDSRQKAHHPGVVMWRTGDRGTIDLHQFAPGPRGIPEVDGIASTARPHLFGGFCGKVPPPELQILITILHDQLLDGHFWRGGFEFRHLIDVSALCRAPVPPNWGLLLDIANTAGIRGAVAAQLIAAHQIAGAPVPSEATRQMLGQLHFNRQKLQFIWPALNRPFHVLGMNQAAWRPLSSRPLNTVVS